MRKAILFIIFILSLSVLILCNGNEDGQEVEKDYKQLAVKFTNQLSERKYEEARSSFDQRMSSAMSLEDLKELWETTIVKTYGQPIDIVNTRMEKTVSQGETLFVVYVTISYLKDPDKADLLAYFDLRVVFNTNGEVAGLWHEPSDYSTESKVEYSSPDYVNKNKFTEEEYNLSLEKCNIKGLLSIPKGDGKYPVVILVHGSGPNDMDETVGANKPFKDIAHGLATKGIAVLRFDKRAYACPMRVTRNIQSLTPKEEVIDDAVSYSEMLSTHEKIDPNHIYIAGHSFGGQLAPRIAKNSSYIDGIISLAGSNANLLDEIIRQTTYLIELDGEITDNEEKRLQAMKDAINRIKNGEMKKGEILLGGPKVYWDDLKNYDAVETAKTLDIPMLFLQGERDYQVTMEQFEEWKSGLSDKENVSFISYPKLNHLFMEGEGKPNPDEYNTPSNVAEKVVEDMANWINDLQ
jgi:hypothetical protein